MTPAPGSNPRHDASENTGLTESGSENAGRTQSGSLRRLRGLIRKEFLQIIRDPSSLAIAFVMPVVLLILFGYGVSLDPRHVPIAVVIEQPSAVTASFAGSLRHSAYLDPTFVHDMHAADELMRRDQVRAIVHLRSDFARDLRGRAPQGAPIQLLLNGVDSNTARIVEGYLQAVLENWQQKHAEETGTVAVAPVELDQRVWFNPALRSRDFLVPGLIAVIMTLIGALLTAMVMAREWERGTMEAMLVTPVRMREVLLGKLIPYFILGTGGLALSVVMTVFLFDVPLRGTVLMLWFGSSLFLLAALGMGLLISAITRAQFVAGQVAILTTFLPAFILSGFIFDPRSMPWPIQIITYLIAARYYVAILQTVFLAGNVWSVIVPNAAALVLMIVVFLTLTKRLSKKSLE